MNTIKSTPLSSLLIGHKWNRSDAAIRRMLAIRIALCTTICCIVTVSTFAKTSFINSRKQIMANDSIKSGFAPINGLKLYYEIHGSDSTNGVPLILLHGGVGGSVMFSPILAQLAKGRQVITVDLQSHGKTADIDRPLRYELMADDIASLLQFLDLKSADVLGYSLGGGVAVRLAIQHPEEVRKLILVSTAVKHDGFYPEVRTAFSQMSSQAAMFGAGMKQSPLNAIYPNVDWTLLFTKLGDLVKRDYDWSKEAGAIKAPTLLIYADADAIMPSSIVEFYGLLGGGHKDAGLDGSGRSQNQLAILPGYTHYTILSSPALVPAVEGFLDASGTANTQAIK
ncbi:MAG TPA: alpha/beta hydrolase [Candidatus Kapabacteria bacterium]|jgi:pimeloyl-ACP methyl ester carboxylesterase